MDIETRIRYAERASELSSETEVDSIILNSDGNFACVYLENEKYFRQSISLNHKNLKLAIKLNDSMSLAHIYNHLGYIYQTFEIMNDSAYYYYNKSLRVYQKCKTLKRDKDKLSQAKIYGSIALMQRNEYDYIGGQSNIIRAINLTLAMPKTKESLDELYTLYNILGLISVGLEEYDEALNYYEKALSINDEFLVDYFVNTLHTKINIAELYRKRGDYDEALAVYNGLLKDITINDKDPASYGAILNNLAYTMFLAKHKEEYKIDSLFTKAYKIFNDLDLQYETSTAGNDMAEFYYETNQKAKALYYVECSYKTGLDIKEFKEVLRSLKMLSKLKEGDSGKAYLYEYIRLKDSFVDSERANRNKFARIQFETDQYIKETERLNTQNILISVIGGVLLLVLGLLYFIKVQRSKNKALRFSSEQEKANQEIYKLMLQQQTKQEEGRLQERHRIAEDLHDSVLGRLFGTRMAMGFLDLKGGKTTLNEYKSHIENLQDIEREVRDISHALKNDEKLSKTSLESIIEQHIDNQSVIGGFKYEIKKETPLNFELLSEGGRVEIYRIIQEAIQNIIKHAQSDYMLVSYALRDTVLEIKIIDHGIGFDAHKNYKGIGLKNIASRVAKLRGHYQITSNPNKGTELTINIPFKSV
ncbi:tetratricopeptide repeat-containing sensor histidine kinase [Flavivirga algicola]|uniref:Tetratricopeptide repeat protein n=1 Tax=Flavivirga algicola TaxID=2729136 RepID=A0ABX1S174_9FLAO|nr:tetratricopeptide repeat-containing sensor histidine kinase [Flavivirga algicola]NMH89000.1 tetratricopeptide repeat protein [Flavivirga algicola]